MGKQNILVLDESKSHHTGLVESWQDNDPESYRIVVYVHYPDTMTVREMVNHLEPAKWWDVETLYIGCTVRCGVKPPQLDRFKAINKDYIIPYGLTFFEDEILYGPDPKLGGSDG